MATGDTIAGRVGERGIVVLSAGSGNVARRRQRLFDMADRLHAIGRRHGLSLHFGSGAATRSLPLSRSYEQALLAAERALADGVRILASEPGRERRSLRELRRQLARAVKERPTALTTEFDRYIEAVSVESHQEVEVARGQLEMGFERIAEPLLAEGAVDQKGYGFLVETLDRSALAARSLGDLFAVYRRAVAELSDALGRPVEAHRDRSLGRVLDHIHRHFADSLSFGKIAKLSGFAPPYFSQLFKRREGVTFETYVSRLRVERAKSLLETTELEVARISELSGFSSAEYFARVFRKVTGCTPTAYKVKARPRSQASRRRRAPK
jgi:YesN/AraC family two-component response regulator